MRDTGIGIPPDNSVLLFNKFSQLDASTTRAIWGHRPGAGHLQTARRADGGEVGVESKEDKGSEFWFTVRICQTGRGRRRNVPPADLRGVRVLIVDDNATNREILTNRLASWAMRSSEAQDGPGALQALYRALDEQTPSG